ncbi:MAG: Single-stranded nucleic acid binding R3H domain protein [Candidatus Levybacteria bacterium GW2011_GWA2_36_13]|nr:MAG: Single-stranded nucleic acid binding R3H domain protein [Candidatus Levybacteria bacterium GW2011_GWA2_36_13]KKP98829.1 MAG: Single-stranded nucleic acid binding R3H domain protein [Candidatus Levybacteria bacterium GW2011_GWB1_36_18]OGH43544.1 MAG: hypothetical protein A3I49_01510 [Candidatus Levybacteria bacterium RIFCSPLOWO2_02_FULL_37_11]
MKKSLNLAQKTIEEFLSVIGIKDPFELSESEEGFDVVLDTQESGIIIGRHGDNLEAIQLVLSLILTKKLGEFKRVSFEVGDYKKNRSDFLSNLAEETKERVISEGKEVIIPNLKSWERRLVHLALQDDNKVVSESAGEGKDRVLIVRPKN